MTDPRTLLAGAAGGALFVGAASVFPRHTRRVLVHGLIVTATLYVYFAARGHAGWAWLGAELAGVVLYGAMALRGLRASPWWIAVAWALHPVWDVALHLVGAGRTFVPAAFPTGCLAWDPVVAAAVAAGVLLRARRITVPAPAAPARYAVPTAGAPIQPFRSIGD